MNLDELDFIITEGEPNPDDFESLSKGLLSHHESQGHKRIWEKYCIFLKDKSGKAHAGIIVTFLWNGMHIDSLWVDESLRGNDYGTKLMKMVEEAAIKKKCTIAYTDTFTWQAPEFYEKLGYKIYGRLEEFPEGNSLSYYYKRLT